MRFRSKQVAAAPLWTVLVRVSVVRGDLLAETREWISAVAGLSTATRLPALHFVLMLALLVLLLLPLLLLPLLLLLLLRSTRLARGSRIEKSCKSNEKPNC
jgi:hypothetical protein